MVGHLYICIVSDIILNDTYEDLISNHRGSYRWPKWKS